MTRRVYNVQVHLGFSRGLCGNLWFTLGLYILYSLHSILLLS